MSKQKDKKRKNICSAPGCGKEAPSNKAQFAGPGGSSRLLVYVGRKDEGRECMAEWPQWRGTAKAAWFARNHARRVIQMMRDYGGVDEVQ